MLKFALLLLVMGLCSPVWAGDKDAKPTDADKARQVLQKDKQDRVQKFIEEVRALEKKYGCALVVKPHITPQGTIGGEVQVVAPE